MIDMTIGQRLRDLRIAEGLNLVEAAEIAGTTKQSLSQIEKGVTKEPGALPVVLWARRYRVNPYWLLTGRGPKSENESRVQELDLETLKSAIVSVKEAARSLDLAIEIFDVAPAIAFAYRERSKLPVVMTKEQYRKFDAQIRQELTGGSIGEEARSIAGGGAIRHEEVAAAPQKTRTRARARRG